MGDGFEVPLEELGTTARDVRTSAELLLGLRPEQELARVAAALPGSLSAEAVTVLAAAWSRRFERSAREVVELADGLAAAVAAYADVDDRTAGGWPDPADTRRAP